ncbi:MAG TPA: GntR family transcriptional regulator [Gaiellales bacterium]|nr:GntR family transcriptional regulator [Gaiellales bacterium]
MPLSALDDQQQLTDRVCAALREAITTGRLEPDARIKQEQIAAELGVSRTPVREALHLLEREGLVRLVPRRGAIVQGFTAADVRELYELRELLEPAAAGLATVRAGADERLEVQHLARLTARQSDGFAPNRDFHHALCAPCGNGLIMRTLDSVWTHRAAEGLFTYQTLPSGAVEQLAAEHDAIAIAFAAADAARVRALVHDHVRAAGSDALERLPGHEDHQAEEIS